jgi:hypothetical protein
MASFADSRGLMVIPRPKCLLKESLFKPAQTSPLAFSTWSLDLGCATDAYLILMASSLANS